MRYYLTNSQDKFNNLIPIVVSEEDIRKNYFKVWQQNKFKKYGRIYNNFALCVEEWKIENAATFSHET